MNERNQAFIFVAVWILSAIWWWQYWVKERSWILRTFDMLKDSTDRSLEWYLSTLFLSATEVIMTFTVPMIALMLAVLVGKTVYKLVKRKY